MKIKANKDYATATFTWNDELTECQHVALGVSDEELNELIANKVHMGRDLDGWTVNVEM